MPISSFTCKVIDCGLLQADDLKEDILFYNSVFVVQKQLAVFQVGKRKANARKGKG